MNLKKTVYIVIILLISVIAYFVYRGIIYIPQSSPDLSLSVLDFTANDSLVPGRDIPSQNVMQDTESITRDEAGKKENVRLIVYYFHATARCTECINIENFTKEVVEKGLFEEKKSVKMTFHSLNIEDSVNEHYINDFEFDVSTVILSKLINNKCVSWKNLEHVWKYADNKILFFKYVKNGIKIF
jgi:hypothetical protein